MKTWTNPELEELEVELTAGGWDHDRYENRWNHTHHPNPNPNPNPNPDEDDGEDPILPENPEEGTPS